MDNVILFLVAFVFSFGGRFILYLLSKRKSGKKKKQKIGIAVELKYLIVKFDLDGERIDNKGFASLVSLLDALIISTTVVAVVLVTDNITLELFIGLILVVLLITVIYEILGRILVKKGYGKNGL